MIKVLFMILAILLWVALGSILLITIILLLKGLFDKLYPEYKRYDISYNRVFKLINILKIKYNIFKTEYMIVFRELKKNKRDNYTEYVTEINWLDYLYLKNKFDNNIIVKEYINETNGLVEYKYIRR